MGCPYCKSNKIVLNENSEYVCADCGTVLGFMLMPPRLSGELRAPLRMGHPLGMGRHIEKDIENGGKFVFKKRYSELVRSYLAETAKKLGRPELDQEAWSIFSRIDKRVYQSKNPRAVAAALVYMAAEKRGFNVSKPQIAVILNVSKFTVRDMVGRLRRYTQPI
jgi:transcription initiation factor TFIIIB Brf1 subunit/transcription initiation factor TFIIB